MVIFLAANIDGKLLTKRPMKKIVTDNSSAVLSVSALSVRHCSYLCHSQSDCFSANYKSSGAGAGAGAEAGACEIILDESRTTVDDKDTTALLPKPEVGKFIPLLHSNVRLVK